MRWVQQAPPSAIPCGQGTLDVEADSKDLAEQLAKITAGAYVTAQVSEAVARALAASAELRALLSPLPRPEVVYQLDEATPLAPRRWRIPFRAFAVPRQS